MRGRGCVYERRDRTGYYARVTIGGQRRYRGGLSTKAMAEAWIERQLRESEHAEALGLPALREDVTFGKFLPRWKSAVKPRTSEKTYAGYCGVADSVLSSFFGSKYLAQIGAGDVEDFVAARAAAGVRPATINRNLTVLSSVLSLAERLHLARQNAAKGVKRARETLRPVCYLDHEDEARLLTALPAWLRPAALLALDAGLRAGEIEQLRRRDVDLRRRVVVVRTSKNREPREVGLTRRVAGALKSHLRGLPKGAASLFSHPDGRTFSRIVYRPAWEAATRAAGLEGFRFHDLRHACGVRLAEAGATPAEIQAVLGHRTLDATMRYIRHAPRDAARSAARLLDRRLEARGRDEHPAAAQG